MSTKIQQQIEWWSQSDGVAKQGESNQSEIARILQVDKSIVCRDIAYLIQQSNANIKKYIHERLPEEYEKCMVGLTAILREAWNMTQQSEDKREKIQALSLAKDCYSMKLDLLTNATVVDDAIRFVSQKSKSKEELKSSSSNNEHNKEESKQPDYDDEQEDETGEIATINQVF